MKRSPEDDLMLGDLARSGLDAADARRMGVEALTASEASAFTGVDDPRAGYKLPYFDLDGKKIEFARVRYLGEARATFNGQQLAERPKYRQPGGTGVELYLPPNLPGGWRRVRDDGAALIAITEGEKKSARACKEGIPTIGLGGVWSFGRSDGNIKDLLPALAQFAKPEREMLILFDSDLATNEQVRLAADSIADLLFLRGVRVLLAYPMPNGEEKVGLDDVLVSGGRAAFDALRETARPVGALGGVSAEFAHIRALARILDIRSNTNKVHTAGDFKSTLVSERFAMVGWKKEGPAKTAKLVPNIIPAASAWLTSPYRREYMKLVYEPGKLFPDWVDQSGERHYNTWLGWPVAPKRGDITPWRELLDHIFKGRPDLRAWFEAWVFYPIRYPGAKLFTACMFFHKDQGIGKTMLGRVITSLYGDEDGSNDKKPMNAITIDASALSSNFNFFAHKRQFMLVEEPEDSRVEHRYDYRGLKTLITGDEITVNLKHQPQYQLRNTLNMMLTTNKPNALKLDEDDRRFFIWEFPPGFPQEKLAQLFAYKESTEGRAAMMWHGINDVDMSKFDPKGRAPMTEVKGDIIEHAKTDLRVFVERCIENYDHVFGINGVGRDCDFATPTEIARLYELEHPKSSASGVEVGRILGEHKDRVAALGQIRTKTAGKQSLYAFRNVDRWRDTKESERADHWDEQQLLPEAREERRLAKLRGNKVLNIKDAPTARSRKA